MEKCISDKIPKTDTNLDKFYGTRSTRIQRPRTPNQWVNFFLTKHHIKPARLDDKGRIICEGDGQTDPNYNPTAS